MQKHIWFGVAIAGMLFCAAPASAQYLPLTSRAKSVEVDMGVLDSLPATSNPDEKRFKKLAPPPHFTPPAAEKIQLIPPMPEGIEAINAPETIPEGLPADKIGHAPRLTPPDLPKAAISSPPEMMPEMPIPLTSAPEPLAAPVSMPTPKPEMAATPAPPRRRVLKPSSDDDAEIAIAEPDTVPVSMPAPVTPPVAAPTSYPSYMTKPGQISAPERVDLPTPKPAIGTAAEIKAAPVTPVTAIAEEPVAPKKPAPEAAPSLPAHKPAVIAPADDAMPTAADSAPLAADEKAAMPTEDVTEKVAEAPAAAPEKKPAEEAPAPTPAPEALTEVPTAADLSLEFTGNSSDIVPASQTKLKNVIRQMKGTDDNRLQVRAYATGEDGSKSSARRISLARALAVRSFLMDNGIKPTRVDVRALGTETDHSPLDRVDLVFAR